MTERLFKGVAASPGLALGRVAFFSRNVLLPQAKSVFDPETEWLRFEEAGGRLSKRMSELQCDIPTAFSDETLEIFSIFGALIEDPLLRGFVRSEIFDSGSTAEWACYRAFQRAIEVISKVPHEHISEKVDDLVAVRDLVLETLQGQGSVREGTERFAKSVVVCERLTPRDILELAREGVAGVVSETGTRCSHVAVLARNLGVPAVLGVGVCCSLVAAGEEAVLDGNRGLFEVSPSEAHLAIYRARNVAWQSYGRETQERAVLPVSTLEGVPVAVLANCESSGDLAELQRRGAQGVGLFRLEFFYMGRVDAPTEEEICTELSAMVSAFPEGEVVVRLLDAGGDKPIPSVSPCAEAGNPAMGLRGVRLLLKRPDVLSAQVRAVLRANRRHGNVSLLIPFVSCLEEVRAIRAHVREEWRRLSASEEDVPPFPRVGMMVEVPSAVAAIDLFAREVDFFSVGTNDLTQHLLAVDRADESVSVLYDSFHPALLRSLQTIFVEALARQIPVTLCGEMAAEPLCLELLVGLGLRSFSVNPGALPFVKDMLREVSLVEASALVAEVKLLRTALEVRGRLQARFVEKFGLERYAMVCAS